MRKPRPVHPNTKLSMAIIENWRMKVLHKRQALDTKRKRVNMIREAFYDISRVGGLFTIENIQNSFIKSVD